MQCDRYREALSAQLDSEPSGIDPAAADAHLAGCAACRSWYERVTRATRQARIGAAAPADLADALLAGLAAARPRTPRTQPALRLALAALAAVQALLAVQVVVTGADPMSPPAHVAHESGAWNLALAAALLGVALRPRQAVAVAPFLGVFVTVLAVVSLPDVASGRMPLTRFGPHLLVLAGFGLVSALARAASRPAPTPFGEPRDDVRPAPRTRADDAGVAS